jgi:hypothetical protein
MMTNVSNSFIAGRLDEYADILEQQQADKFRISACRRAARTLAGLDRELSDIYRSGGSQDLFELDNVGTGIASAIAQLLQTGRWSRPERLRGALNPEKLLQTGPASGPGWLPVLHTWRGPWHLTALFSNTARAHALNRSRDWVVIYFYDDDHAEGQHTLVTETSGPLRGSRVVRGRETECRDCHTATAATEAQEA